MAVAFRDSASTGPTANAATISINKPALTAQGDVLVAAITLGGIEAVTSPGWTLVSQLQISASYSIAVLYLVAGASEPASYTFSVSTNRAMQGGIAAYSGVDGSAPINTSASSNDAAASSTSIPAPSVTTTVADCLICAIHTLTAGTTGDTLTPDATTAGRYQVQAGGTIAKRPVLHTDFVQASAGASAVKTATSTLAGIHGALQVALKPSAGADVTPPAAPTGLSATPMTQAA